MVINNLFPKTTYNLRVANIDYSGNLALSPNQTFTTLSIGEEEAAGETSPAVQAAPAVEKETFIADTAKKAIDIIGQYAGQISLSALESTLFSQYDSLEKIAQLIPSPAVISGPRVSVSPSTATIDWKTNKQASSFIAFAPEEIYSLSAGRDNPYAQIIGSPDEKLTDHSITLYDLKSDTTYHYQLRNKPPLVSMAKSNDFVFRTEKEAAEIISHNIENISNEKALFRWVTNLPTSSAVKYTPYRNNVLVVDETKNKENKSLVTVHELEISDFEPGVVYQVELFGEDAADAVVSRVIPTFSTSADDLSPLITNVQAESAISAGKDARIQTIISWQTNELSTSRVYYQQGFAGPDTEQLAEKTALDSSYTKKHVAVLTKFNPGAIYTFRVESIDSGGNTTLSKPYTLLAPRQKEPVFQIIIKNLEQTFSWVKDMGL